MHWRQTTVSFWHEGTCQFNTSIFTHSYIEGLIHMTLMKNKCQISIKNAPNSFLCCRLNINYKSRSDARDLKEDHRVKSTRAFVSEWHGGIHQFHQNDTEGRSFLITLTRRRVSIRHVDFSQCVLSLIYIYIFALIYRLDTYKKYIRDYIWNTYNLTLYKIYTRHAYIYFWQDINLFILIILCIMNMIICTKTEKLYIWFCSMQSK